MATPQQNTAINTKLSVSLATVTDDRLIELCLLYRAEPKVRPAFVTALKTDIDKRFTPLQIQANDVMFSIIVNFYNQFSSGYVFNAAQKTAITNLLNVTLSALTDDRLIELCLLHRAAPFVYQDFVDKLTAEIIRRFTPAQIAANDVIFSVLKKFETAFILIRDPSAGYQDKFATLIATPTTGKEQWFIDNEIFFKAVLNKAEPLNYLANNAELVSYAFNSTQGFNYIINKINSIDAFVGSAIAMAVIAGSDAILNKFIENSDLLKKLVSTEISKTALMNNNNVFQNNKLKIYNKVKLTWTRQAATYGTSPKNTNITSLESAVANPNGFVFASLGYDGYDSGGRSGGTKLLHPNTNVAVLASTTGRPTSMISLDGISFNGSKFMSTEQMPSGSVAGYAYVELWIPPTP